MRTDAVMVAVLMVLAVWPASGLPAAAAATTAPPGAAPEKPAIPPKRAGKDYAPFPNPDAGYVTDIAGLLTDAEEEKIEQWLWRTESKTGVENAVVIISSIKDYKGTPNYSIEQFAEGLFNRYRIGNLPKNDGVLLLVTRKDRKVRIELGKHYGRARGRDARRIMQKVIIPRFKEDDYAAGITDGVRAIMREFAGVRIGINWPLIILLIAIPILVLIIVSLFRSGKRGWGWVCVGLLIVAVMGVLWVVWTTVKHMPRGRSGGWSSGGFGGGFGGGSSGGGGATGSW